MSVSSRGSGLSVPRRLADAVIGFTLLTTLSPAQAVDTLVVNARIYTMDAALPQAEAMAVDNGRILAVGDSLTLRTLSTPQTTVIDAQGRVILPGFNDSHMHPQPAFEELGPYGMLDLTPEGGVESHEALRRKIRRKAALVEPGKLIWGMGYNDNLVGGHPSASDLDQLTIQHPLVLIHSSGHRLAVNSAALAAAGIDAQTRAPIGGKIVRDAQGKATGIILETAKDLFKPLLTARPVPDEAALLEAYRRELQAFVDQGITSITDAAAEPERLAIYRRLLLEGFPLRIHTLVLAEHLDWLEQNIGRNEWQVPGLTLAGVKIFHGNSLSGKTAWLYQSYAHDPTYFGIPPKRNQAELDALIARVHDAGLQAAVHSNGDREIDMTLNAIEKAQAANPRPDPRHRIEHASVVNRQILARVHQLGVVLAPHSYVYNHGEKMVDYGTGRWDWMHPNRTALDMGIAVGGNSDYPISPAKPLQRVQSMVTRRARSDGQVYGAAQRVSPEQAVYIWTHGSAEIQHSETDLGSLQAGKLADWIMLSGDPFLVGHRQPAELQSIEVLMTVIGGEVVYRRERP